MAPYMNAGIMNSGLFSYEPVLPAQYYPCYSKGKRIEPEKRLMVAVLESTIEEIKKNFGRSGRRAKRLLDEDLAYIECTDRSWAFSFENLCESLNLDSGAIRREMRKYRVDGI